MLQPFQSRKNNLVLWVILAVGLVHATIYVYLMPPWQHYDEPNHFEYIWLLIKRGALLQRGDYDQEMRRAVARSMIEHGFFDRMTFLPDLNAVNEPIWIGAFSQVGDPPAYYLLASLPARLFAAAGIEAQLYAARWTSVVLYLLSLLGVWAIVRELTTEGSRLRWFVPLTVALIPSFTELMTAINSDAAAVASFTLFLWSGVVLIRRGFSLRRLLATALLALLCAFSKSNVILALPLLVVCWGLTFLSRMPLKVLWAACLVILLGGLVGVWLVLRWDAAAFWYADAPQGGAQRLETPGSAFGTAALEVSNPSASYKQLLTTETIHAFRGRRVTFGAWVWAQSPLQLSPPQLVINGKRLTIPDVWNVGTAPAFFTFSVDFPADTGRAWLVLTAPKNAVVIYDDLMLCEGEFPAGQTPFLQGQTVKWGGRQCENVLRNPSAEAVWPKARLWADQLLSRFFPDRGRLSLIIHATFDPASAFPYYRKTFSKFLRSFWAVFAWGNIFLIGSLIIYRVLMAVTFLGIVGGLIAVARRWRSLPGMALAFLALAMLFLWGATLVRGAIYIFSNPYIPPPRYAYPVIAPTMLWLAAGWLEFGALARKRWQPRLATALPVGLLCGLIFLALWSIFTVVRFY